MTPRLSVVVPTMGRPAYLVRVLDALAAQDVPRDAFEVIVAHDAKDPVWPGARDAATPLPVRRIHAEVAGASGARNAGWRAAEAPLVCFLDDDVRPVPGFVRAHLAAHDRHPGEADGVLGLVRWAPELRVTPFMAIMDRGLQFDFVSIRGEEAGWGRFVTANASLKRALLERAGGFDEVRFPFGYEDTELAYRLHRDHGFRLWFAREATGDHLRPVTFEEFHERLDRIARSERQYVTTHPENEPWFYTRFKPLAGLPPRRGIAQRLARVVPPRTPWLGRRVWERAESAYRQALAPRYVACFEAAEPRGSQPSGSPPGGPK